MRQGESEVRLQALHNAPPQQLTTSVVKPEERPAASGNPGQESYVRSSGIITLSARWPGDGLGRFGMRPASDEATMINHVGVTNVARQRQQENQVSHKYPPGDLNPGPL